MKKHAKVVIELDYWMNYDEDGIDSGINPSMSDEDIRALIKEWVDSESRSDLADRCRENIKDIVIENY